MLLELAFKTSVLMAVAGAAGWLLRGKSAAVRHLIWSLAFGAILLLPVLSLVLPVVHVPVGQTIAQSEVLFRTNAVARVISGGRLHGHSTAVGASSIDWRLLLTAIWLTGAVFGVGRMLMGWLALERLRRRSASFGAAVNGVDVLESERGSMPMTYGLFRPVIFLPAEAHGWAGERLQIVIQHEMAHVTRRDSAMHVMARLALSCYWWNPLAWWGWREFLKEQERAADDLVLNQGACGTDYAGHLLEIARLLQRQTRGPVWRWRRARNWRQGWRRLWIPGATGEVFALDWLLPVWWRV